MAEPEAAHGATGVSLTTTVQLGNVGVTASVC